MKLLLLPVAAAATSVSLASDLSVMRETLVGIAEGAKKSGEPISAGVKSTIQSMLDQIKSNIESALLVDKNDAQTLLNNALEALDKCKTDRETEFAGVVADATQARKDASKEFHECKVGESAGDSLLQNVRDDPSHANHGWETHETHDYGYDPERKWHDNSVTYSDKQTGEVYEDQGATWESTSHEVHAHGEEDRLCKKLNATVKSFTAKVQKQNDADYCEPEKPAEWGQGVYDFFKNLESSYDWFNKMDTFESTYAERYRKERYECHLARQRHYERVVKCGDLQKDFESKSCAEANQIDEECDYYADCYETMEAEWLTVNKSTADKEVQFKKQQHALEILQCYGDQILQDKTDLSECDDEAAACADCSPKLDIDYVSPHIEITCGEALGTNRPCGETWFTTNYAPYENSDTPVCECVACSAPAVRDFVSPNADA